MKRRGFTALEITCLLAVIVTLAVFLYPIFGRSRGSSRASCQSHLKQIGLAMGQYRMDSDQKLVPVSTDRGGWVDILQPYTISRKLFHCPNVNGDVTAKTSDYFYNSRLAEVPLEGGSSSWYLAQPESTIMIGDGQPDSPTDAHINGLTETWRGTSNSPARRHFDMANYLFADGHVKALHADAIDDGPIRKDQFGASFAIRRF